MSGTLRVARVVGFTLMSFWLLGSVHTLEVQAKFSVTCLDDLFEADAVIPTFDIPAAPGWPGDLLAVPACTAINPVERWRKKQAEKANKAGGFLKFDEHTGTVPSRSFRDLTAVRKGSREEGTEIAYRQDEEAELCLHAPRIREAGRVVEGAELEFCVEGGVRMNEMTPGDLPPQKARNVSRSNSSCDVPNNEISVSAWRPDSIIHGVPGLANEKADVRAFAGWLRVWDFLHFAQAKSQNVGRLISRGMVWVAYGVVGLPGFLWIYSCSMLRIWRGQNLGDAYCECQGSWPVRTDPISRCLTRVAMDTMLLCRDVPIDCDGSTARIPVFRPYTFVVPYNDTRYLELPLTPLLPSPNVIPPSVVSREGGSYYLLWKAIEFMYNWVADFGCPNASSILPQLTPVVPNWEPIEYFRVSYEGVANFNSRLPLASLSRRRSAFVPNAWDFLLVVRGAVSQGDWASAMRDTLILGKEAGGVREGPGGIAEFLAHRLGLPLTAALSVNQLGRVILAGHSLGADLAHITGVLLSQKIPHLTAFGTPRFYAVLFGAPRTGSSKHLLLGQKLMSSRNIVGELDPVPTFPCRSTVGCPKSLAVGPRGRAGRNYEYGTHGGDILITAKDLGGAWNWRYSNLEAVAWHTCAYTCWVTRNFAPADKLTQCDPSIKDASPFSCPYFGSQFIRSQWYGLRQGVELARHRVARGIPL